MRFRTAAVATCLAIGLGAGILVWALTSATPRSASKPLPNPNGYDKFVQAGRALTVTNFDYAGADFDYARADSEKLAKVVKANREPLLLVKEGLEIESRVPSESAEVLIDEMVHIKRLATIMAGSGRLALHEERRADAAREFVDTIRLGQKSSRGGPLLTAMVGVAVARLGVSELERMVADLDPQTCSNTIPVLREVLAEFESPEQTLENERLWARQIHGSKTIILRWLTARQLKPAEQRTATALKNVQSRIETLIIRLQEQAQRPTQTAD